MLARHEQRFPTVWASPVCVLLCFTHGLPVSLDRAPLKHLSRIRGSLQLRKYLSDNMTRL
jgi:hypothetical protein